MAFVDAATQRLRRQALLEQGQNQIIGGLKTYADLDQQEKDRELRRQALLGEEQKLKQASIDKANEAEAKANSDFNKQMRDDEQFRLKSAIDLFKETGDPTTLNELGPTMISGYKPLSPMQKVTEVDKFNETKRHNKAIEGLTGQKIEAGLNKPPKEPQQPAQNEFQAATYADRTKQAEDYFSNPEYNKTATSRLSRMSQIAPDEFQSEPVKLASQAERNFTNAVLRRESGSAISDSEFKNAEKQYFPRPGDPDSVIEQKRQNRLAVINGLQREGARVLKNQGPSPVAAPVPGQSLSHPDPAKEARRQELLKKAGL